MAAVSLAYALHRSPSAGPAQAGGRPAMVILHGLYGSKRNWRGIADRLVRLDPAAGPGAVYAADLPNHGDTFARVQQGRGVPMGWPALADSLEALLAAVALRDGHRSVTLLGHSLGGQAAMQAAFLGRPLFRAHVRKLVVVDVAPRPLRFRGSEMAAYLDRMLAIEAARVASRQEAAALLREAVPSEQVVQFLLSSGRVAPGAAAFTFGLPLAALGRGMRSLEDTYAEVPRHPQHALPTLFIRGEHSAFIQPQDRQLIADLFPQHRLTTVPGCAHWPHHESPEGFLAALLPFLP